jgi:hypothetical protein
MKCLRWLWLCTLVACPSHKGLPDGGPIDAGPAQLSEREPNDRPEDALVITESAVVQARLDANPAKPDEDWYALAPAAPRVVDLSVSAIPGVDVAFEIYDDTARNRLLLVNSQGEGKPERLPSLGVRNKLYLKVYSVKKGAGGSYTLTVLFSEPKPGFESEPNDRAADANPIALGQPISGTIGHPADEDWFRYELSSPAAGAADASFETGRSSPVGDGGLTAPPLGASGGLAQIGGVDAGSFAAADAGYGAPGIALRIELSAVEGVRFELQVLSAAEAPLFQVRGKENEGLSIRNVGVRSTDQFVYVAVKSAWIGTGKEARRGYNPDKPYVLNVSVEEAGANAELEPNDDLFRATPLPRNGYREGFLSPKTDVDYYVLRTEEPVLARFHLSGVDKLDLMLSVVAPDEKGGEKVLLRANDGAVKEPEILNSVYCAGQCWVKVEGAQRKIDGKWVKDYENSEQPYRLTVSSVPDIGAEEREPNNTPAQATPIQISHPIRGTVHPKKDVDFFRLDLSNRPVRVPLRVTATGLLKVHLGLYLHRMNEEGKLSLLQTADQAKGDAPEVIRYSAEPGIYFIEVRDSKNRESNFQDYYQLTVEEGD